MHQDYRSVSVGWSLHLSVHHVRRFLRFYVAGPAWVPEWSSRAVLLPSHKPRFNYMPHHSISHGVLLVCLLVGLSVSQSLLSVFAFFASSLLLKCLNVLSHHCPCPPATKIAVNLAFIFFFKFIFYCSSKRVTQENLLEVFWGTYCSCKGKWAQIWNQLH